MTNNNEVQNYDDDIETEIPSFLYRYGDGHIGTGLNDDEDVTGGYLTFTQNNGWNPDNLPSFLYKNLDGRICIGMREEADLTYDYEKWIEEQNEEKEAREKQEEQEKQDLKLRNTSQDRS